MVYSQKLHWITPRKAVVPVMDKNPFNDIEARNWLFDTAVIDSDCDVSFEGLLFILGSGPFDQIEFANFCAKKFECLVCYTESKCIDYTGVSEFEGGFGTSFLNAATDQSRKEMIVVAGNEFPASILNSLFLQKYYVYESNFEQKYWFEFVDTPNGLALFKSPSIENISIISQEMFLARLLRSDALHRSEKESEFLSKHEREHKALIYCNEIKEITDKLDKADPNLLKKAESDCFKWPTTDAGYDSGDAIDDPEAWPQVGLLSHMGYTVGADGLYRGKRQEILEHVFKDDVPNVDSPEYMQEWGSPDSSKRLSKMANSIASFTRNAKRKKTSSMYKAIRDWEGDLAWLKETFYDGLYDGSFEWPSSDYEN